MYQITALWNTKANTNMDSYMANIDIIESP